MPELPKGTEDPGRHLGQAGRLLHPPPVWLLVSHWKNPTGFDVSETASVPAETRSSGGKRGEREANKEQKGEKRGAKQKGDQKGSVFS